MFSFFSKKYVLATMILIIILFVGKSCFLKDEYTLIITNRKNNKEWKFKLKEKKFILGYIHSVMKTSVEEYFEVDDKANLILVKTIYSSYGVGLPFYPEEGELELKEGKFILSVNKVFKELNMSISPIAKHTIQIDGKIYFLDSFLDEDNKKIKINIKIN